jgi:hypothetical protein
LDILKISNEMVRVKAMANTVQVRPFALSLSKGCLACHHGLDKLSPNGFWVSKTELNGIEA